MWTCFLLCKPELQREEGRHIGLFSEEQNWNRYTHTERDILPTQVNRQSEPPIPLSRLDLSQLLFPQWTPAAKSKVAWFTGLREEEEEGWLENAALGGRWENARARVRCGFFSLALVLNPSLWGAGSTVLQYPGDLVLTALGYRNFARGVGSTTRSWLADSGKTRGEWKGPLAPRVSSLEARRAGVQPQNGAVPSAPRTSKDPASGRGRLGNRRGAVRSAPRTSAFPSKRPAPAPGLSLFSSLRGGVESRRRAFLGGWGSSEHSSQRLASQQSYFLPSALTPGTRARTHARTRAHTYTHIHTHTHTFFFVWQAETCAWAHCYCPGWPGPQLPSAPVSETWPYRFALPCMAKTSPFPGNIALKVFTWGWREGVMCKEEEIFQCL